MSTQTIRNRLHKADLRAYSLARHTVLTQDHVPGHGDMVQKPGDFLSEDVLFSLMKGDSIFTSMMEECMCGAQDLLSTMNLSC